MFSVCAEEEPAGQRGLLDLELDELPALGLVPGVFIQECQEGVGLVNAVRNFSYLIEYRTGHLNGVQCGNIGFDLCF